MGLLGVPRTLGPQHAHLLVEASERGGERLGELGNVQRRQVVGLERPIEIVPCDGEHPLIRRTQTLHDGYRHSRRVVDGKLDVGKHVARVALRDEQRSTRTGRVDTERTPVDDTHAHGQGVDAQAHPRKVEERQRREHLDFDAMVRTEQLDRSLGDPWRTRYGVEDLAMAVRRVDEGLDDTEVDLVEAGRLLVQGVERCGVADRISCRMACGAQISDRDAPDRLDGPRGEQVGARRPEPDDHDPTTRHDRGRELRRGASRAGAAHFPVAPDDFPAAPDDFPAAPDDAPVGGTTFDCFASHVPN